jgi:type II secretory pathway pseudopilin PulG
MPLDPNIILQSTPTPTPFQQYGQLLQLRNAQQQGQLQQAQLQGANLQNQQQQIQLNAEQTLDKAYQSAFTTGDDGNPSLNQDKLSSYLAQNGAGHLLPQVMKGFTDMKKSAADTSSTGTSPNTTRKPAKRTISSARSKRSRNSKPRCKPARSWSMAALMRTARRCISACPSSKMCSCRWPCAP